MSARRHATLTLTAALVVGLLAPAGAAQARPGDPAPPVPLREAPANGVDRNERAARLPVAAVAPRTATRPSVAGYPRQTVLRTYAINPDDRSLKLGAVPYHAIAPRLNALQARSRRVSAEVIGESARGRDLYLVTVTAPETAAESRRQEAMRRLIEENPARAAKDRRLFADYKSPLFFNANIHGNEWEGTDGVLRVIEELATSRASRVRAMLQRSRLYFVITMNPDGRVAGTRANANGFNLNRDFITQTQPETRAVRDVIIDTQALVMLDLHGYVNGTLIEPTTPPHGQNYEYDLFIKHAYPNALAMERAVLDLGYTEAADGVKAPQIPFRDFPEGWDDWPPIFTPQYAAFHGTVSHTIEIPLRVNNRDYEQLPAAELRRRAAINTAVAAATVRAAIGYTTSNRRELLADQIEIFRRGEAGEPQRPAPVGIVPGFGPEDVYTTTFPRAYVIPVGSRQRSAPAAARLVDFLAANDVEVLRSSAAFRLGGRSYPRGTYVVDMHQAKRGLANVILEAGGDVTDRVDAMYDISAWSHRLLWGSSVDIVRSGALRVPGRRVALAAPTGSVRGVGPRLSLQLDDVKDLAALNALLDLGVRVRWHNDGSVSIPASARRRAVQVAERYGVTLRATSRRAGRELEDLVVAAAAASDELWALQEMGFDVRPVSTAVLNDSFDWSDVDVLLVSSGLNYADLNPAALAALRGYLAEGGVVTRGLTGAAFNAAAGLLTAQAVEGRDDANGIVNVDNAGGPITADALRHSFVYSPLWFTGLGSEVVVEQRYDEADVLVAGHWRARKDGTGGQSSAAGQASVVRGVDESGAAVVLFGTEPLFRAHPKGLYSQVGRALHWTALRAG